MQISPKTQIDKSWWLSWFSEDKQNTRQTILLAAFKEIHIQGYQAASIQNIITQAGVTKGALYHHFDSKQALLMALIDEVFSRYVDNTYIKPLEASNDPITVLIQTLIFFKQQMSDQDIALGCPLYKLAQETTALDEDIHQRIEQLYLRKNKALVAAFKRGQIAGNVKKNASAESIAMMVEAMMEGCMSMAKRARSLDILSQCGGGLIKYLEQHKIK